MDFFTTALTLSLAVFVLGLGIRLLGWFRLVVSRPAPSPGDRLRAVCEALPAALAPRRLLAMLGSLVLDVLFQVHILRASPVRWLAHMAIFVGFVGLVVMHAMDGVISYTYFPAYEPTLDPYQFLRNLLGGLVLFGVALALCRRLTLPGLRRVSGRMDWLALGWIAAIVLSGFTLEAAKMVSPTVFQRMVDEYLPGAEAGELQALKAYWAAEEGMIFPDVQASPDSDQVRAGFDVHESSCAACHSATASAFLSRPLARPLSRLLAPAARVLEGRDAADLLWYAHVLLALAGLAWLPFGKMLHAVSTPLNLVLRPRPVRPGDVAGAGGPAGPGHLTAVARALGLDACTHCGVCSLHCSVAPIHTALGNADILPSEKLRSLGRFARGAASQGEVARFAEGSFICTECLRCTEVCPARIDLQDLWLASKRELAAREHAEPHGLMVRRTAAQWAAYFRQRQEREGDLEVAAGVDTRRAVNLTDRREVFWACIQCTTCTNVCPVVAAAGDAVRELDVTPHQLMNLMRMGLKELALGSRMVWSCVTCYKCQEHCPQGIKVADVLYELRNIAAEHLRPVRAGVPDWSDWLSLQDPRDGDDPGRKG